WVAVPSTVACEVGGNVLVVSPPLRTTELTVSKRKSAETIESNWLTSNRTPPRKIAARRSSQGNGSAPGRKKASKPTITPPGPAEKAVGGTFPAERHHPTEPVKPDVPVARLAAESSSVLSVTGGGQPWQPGIARASARKTAVVQGRLRVQGMWFIW